MSVIFLFIFYWSRVLYVPFPLCFCLILNHSSIFYHLTSINLLIMYNYFHVGLQSAAYITDVFLFYLFIWLCRVLVVAHGAFAVSCGSSVSV